MAEGRPSRGESVTENLQDYVEESLERSTNLDEQAAAANQLERTEVDLQQTQAERTQPSTSSGMAPDVEEQLQEHLAATENVRGAGQADTSNAGAADTTSAAVQDEARSRMGNIRS
jgi:hypothetical protein